jgi:hypothetical protein
MTDDGLDRLKHALEHNARQDQLIRILSSLGGSTSLVNALDGCLADREGLRQIADRSYAHILGFDKIVLLSVPAVAKLRLHVWWPEQERVLEHPHNHRYASHSFIVAGSLRMTMHIVEGHGPNVVHYREGSGSQDKRWRYEKVGTTTLSSGMTAEMPAGSTYSMSAEVVHSIAPPQGFCATLFLELVHERDYSDIFLGTKIPVPGHRAYRSFTIQEVGLMLDKLKAAL